MYFTVIIPTYNRSELIAETLHSVLTQTLLPAQVVVVDDGSTDDTENVVRRFNVDYVKIVNAGPGYARNVGVSLANQEWIAFCDSDDLWKPTYLEKFASHLRNTSSYGFANWLDVENNTWTSNCKFRLAPKDFFSESDIPLYEKLIEFTPIWPSATVIKKSFFEEIGGFNIALSRLPTEDYEFALRCNEYTLAVIMHEPLVGIRKHTANYSRGRIRQDISDAELLCWARDNHEAGKRLYKKITSSIEARRLSAFREAFVEGNLKLTRQIALNIPSYAFSLKDLIKFWFVQSRIPAGSFIRLIFGRKKKSITRVY